MSYTYRRPTVPPRRAVIARAPARARGVQRVGLGELGILPLVAAALPTVKGVLENVGKSIFAGLDPGKKRDAERQARAQMYEQLAINGSITAANRVYSAAIGIHGGEGPTKEANWYKAAWAHIQAAVPDIAQKVPALPRVGLPDPQRPELQPDDAARIQAEINTYHGIASQAERALASSPVGTLASGFPGGPLGIVVTAAIGFAFFRRSR